MLLSAWWCMPIQIYAFAIQSSPLRCVRWECVKSFRPGSPLYSIRIIVFAYLRAPSQICCTKSCCRCDNKSKSTYSIFRLNLNSKDFERTVPAILPATNVAKSCANRAKTSSHTKFVIYPESQRQPSEQKKKIIIFFELFSVAPPHEYSCNNCSHFVCSVRNSHESSMQKFGLVCAPNMECISFACICMRLLHTYSF